MMKILIVMGALCAMQVSVCSLCGQTAFPATGGDVANEEGYSLSFTVGQTEVMSTTSRVTSVEVARSGISEGVQQAYRVNEVGIDGVEPLGVSVNILPNPTTDHVTVVLGDVVSGLSLELYTSSGQILQKEAFKGTMQKVDISAYPSGSYMLRLVAEGKESNYRIIKIR